MKYRVISISNNQAKTKLFNDLRGKVFHITSLESMLQIFKVGFIENNKSKKFKQNWNSNSYFRNRGFVSVCDLYNNVKPNKIRKAALSKYCIFGQDWGPDTVFLFLNQKLYSKLITWEEWKADKKVWNETIVPHLESGYRNKIRIEDISEMWIVNIKDYIYIEY